MSREELCAWLRLLRLEFSPSKVRALLERFGDAEGILRAPADALREVAGMREADVVVIERAAREPIEVPAPLQSGEARLVLESDPDFPRPLVGLPDIPPALLVWGALQERDRFAVGVVGTRQPSAYGRMVAERFTRDLCEAGLTIVSGGALGIDTVAHRTALEAGGRTVAILGSGLGSPYPAENRALFRRIAEAGGAVVSQYAWDATPDQWRFPVRNRLIAAWGLGVLVVEAPAQSGALITARLAAEYGREVFAVPGSIDNPKSKGCHALIKRRRSAGRIGGRHPERAENRRRAARAHREPAPADRSAGEATQCAGSWSRAMWTRWRGRLGWRCMWRRRS
jgi:DNA processing protein